MLRITKYSKVKTKSIKIVLIDQTTFIEDLPHNKKWKVMLHLIRCIK